MKTEARSTSGNGPGYRKKQSGVVLLTVLIVLVAMLLGALTMMRASDTSTLIAGNVAFKQNGASSADMAIESAINWLGNQSSAILQSNQLASGYLASYDPEGPNIKAGQSWDAYWNDTAKLPSGYKCWISWSGSPPVATCNSSDSTASSRYDEAGNRSAYIIHRMCAATGSATDSATGCQLAVSSSSAATSSKGVGKVTISNASQVYYRITARVVGPRNTVTYTQVMVAL